MCTVKRFTLAAFGAALLALVLAPPPANAQRFYGQLVPGVNVGRGIPGAGGLANPNNYYDPFGYSRQAAFNIALYGRAISQVPPYALGYTPYPQLCPTGYSYATPNSPYAGDYGGTITSNPAAYSNTGYSSPGYGSGYGAGSTTPYSPSYDPYSGFLRGAADVINADGKFHTSNQQANLMREQVKSAHLDNRRKAFDEFLYERANTPTWLDDRERAAKMELRYTLSNPTPGEILAGTSLNVLLDNLKQMQSRGVQGADVPLDEELLKQIKLTARAGANADLLKNDGRLSWPLALTGPEFEEERKAIERNSQAAVSEAEFGGIDPTRLKGLAADVNRTTERLGARIGKMTPTQYIAARNYLKQLSDAVDALGQPDAMSYINNKYTAKGKTVGELVKNMSGLKFAPAAPGDERAYRDLYDQEQRQGEHGITRRPQEQQPDDERQHPGEQVQEEPTPAAAPDGADGFGQPGHEQQGADHHGGG